MTGDVQVKWEEFLNPEVMRTRMISASLYICAFELLKDAIISRPRDMYLSGFDQAGDIISPEYESKVLSRNSNVMHASLDWLKEMGALDEADLDCFTRVKQCRNDLAHNMMQIVDSDGLPTKFDELFGELVRLLSKLETWWIMKVELATDPDIDPDMVDPNG